MREGGDLGKDQRLDLLALGGVWWLCPFALLSARGCGAMKDACLIVFSNPSLTLQWNSCEKMPCPPLPPLSSQVALTNRASSSQTIISNAIRGADGRVVIDFHRHLSLSIPIPRGNPVLEQGDRNKFSARFIKITESGENYTLYPYTRTPFFLGRNLLKGIIRV